MTTYLQRFNNEYLSVKMLELGAEAKIIRHKERKWKAKARAAIERQKREKADEHLTLLANLKRHRRTIVRVEARACNVALAFLRGLEYEQVERHIEYQRFGFCGTTEEDFWNKVAANVARFGVIYGSDQNKAKKAVNAWRNRHPQYVRAAKLVPQASSVSLVWLA